MQLKEFINRMDGVNPELELYCNNDNIVYDVVIQEDKIILKFENPLELYYTHKGKMDNLKEMITAIKDSADVEEVSEIEVVEIAHNLKLGFNEVKKEFIKNGIGVNVL